MAHNIEKLPGEPIIIHTQDVQDEAEIKAQMLALLQLLETQPEPVSFILDLTDSPMAHSLDAVTLASNMAARQLKLFQHPKIRRVVFVTTNQALRRAAEAMDNEMFGNTKITVVDTVDDALAFARSAT